MTAYAKSGPRAEKRRARLTPSMVNNPSPRPRPGLFRRCVFVPQPGLHKRLRRNPGADLTGNPGAAETAIAVRVLRQVLLVIVLGEIERRRVLYVCGDGGQALRGQRLGVACARGFGGGALLRREHIDAGPVLRTDIVALTHALGRVVAFPKSFEQALIGDFLRIVDHEHHLVMASAPAAPLLVGRVRRKATGVADRGHVNAVAELPEFALGAPEAAKPEHRHGEPLGIGPLERLAVDEMLPRRGDGAGTPGQSLLRVRHLGFLGKAKHDASPYKRGGYVQI